MDIPYPQRYLIAGQASPTNFITCKGRSSIGSIRLDLYLYRDSGPSVHINGDVNKRYKFKCSRPIPAGSQCIDASEVTCQFGVDPASRDDEGTYSCQVAQCLSTAMSSELQVGIYDRLIINSAYLLNTSSDIVATTSFTLRCQISYSSDLYYVEFQWLHNGVPVISATNAASLPKSKNTSYSYFDYTVKATKEDAGSYVCVCSRYSQKPNYIDSQPPKPIIIQVKYGSIITAFTSSPHGVDFEGKVNIFTDGLKDTLLCTADGYPEPTLSLTLNNKPTKAVVQSKSISKTIASLKPNRDNGTYCCHAVNIIEGEEKKAISCLEVVVNERPKVVAFYSTRSHNKLPGSNCLPREQHAEIACYSSGIPSPLVFILSSNGTLLASGNEVAFYDFNGTREFSASLTFVCKSVNKWNSTTVWKTFSYCSASSDLGFLLPVGLTFAMIVLLVLVIVYRRKTRNNRKNPEEKHLLCGYNQDDKKNGSKYSIQDNSKVEPWMINSKGANVKRLARCLKEDWITLARGRSFSETYINNIKKLHNENNRNFHEMCAETFLAEWIEVDEMASPRVVCNVLNQAEKGDIKEIQRLFVNLSSWTVA